MARGAKKYPLPLFLSEQGVSQDQYGRWLDKVANAVVRRDRKRLSDRIDKNVFREAIHLAVENGGDTDFYTGEFLNWKLLQHFNGSPVPARKQHEVPTVDHEVVSATSPAFRICSLRTNKCKSDFSVTELKDFCQKFLKFQSSKAKEEPEEAL